MPNKPKKNSSKRKSRKRSVKSSINTNKNTINININNTPTKPTRRRRRKRINKAEKNHINKYNKQIDSVYSLPALNFYRFRPMGTSENKAPRASAIELEKIMDKINANTNLLLTDREQANEQKVLQLENKLEELEKKNNIMGLLGYDIGSNYASDTSNDDEEEQKQSIIEGNKRIWEAGIKSDVEAILSKTITKSQINMYDRVRINEIFKILVKDGNIEIDEDDEVRNYNTNDKKEMIKYLLPDRRGRPRK
jgi:hypothetical protein